MAPVAGAIIVPLIAQVGIPLAVQFLERWSKEDPTNPQLSDWLAFLKHPVLTKTYDEQMRGPGVPPSMAEDLGLNVRTTDRSAPSRASGFGPG